MPELTTPDDIVPNLQNCEDEPIRVPGSVQRHGFLLLLDKGYRMIIAASENASDFLGLPITLLLGSFIDTVLSFEILGALRAPLLTPPLVGQLTYLGSFQIKGGFYSVVTHRVDGELIMEFELLKRLVSPELTNQVITNFVHVLSRITVQDELCRSVTNQVKDLTGFNRVLLYRFDEFGHGTVLTEENDGVLDSYLDLRFPASDIPQQARDLYLLNTIRIIPDAGYVPSPLLGDSSRSVRNLDLSMSLLRSVSPIHLQYMHNMGTLSSMSISIVCEGKLWGLISCHSAQPHSVPYLVRSACDLLSKLVGTQLASFHTASRLRELVDFHAVHRRLLTHMASETDYLAALPTEGHDLLRVTDARGSAIVLDGKCFTVGQTPDDAAILRLAAWLDESPEVDSFHTSYLSEHLPWAGEIASTASGLIAIRISALKPRYVMWFRSEIVETVEWAGKPKSAGEAASLHPRRSFEIWREQVHGRSQPWSEMAIESAIEFRSAIVTISLKRTEEALHLGEARFSQLTHTLPNLVWTATDDGELTYVNQMWLDQGFGTHGLWYQQAQLVAEDESRCADLWSAAVRDDAPLECEVRFRASQDAPERWNLVRSIPFLHANGTRAGWVGTFTDLTDKYQRDAALRMTEKLALTGRMTSVIAHEINNPLEALGNLLYLLGSRLPQDSEAQSYLSLADRELLRISAITKQTLRWSSESAQKLEHGTVCALFDNVLRLYAGKIRNKEVRIEVENAGDLTFYGEAGPLAQVLGNLVSNAVQAVPVGGRIFLTASQTPETLSVAVRDEGHGMSAETLRHLFKPFYTTKGDLGNGLGLYISKEIVERHGGQLLVTSQEGVGTEFVIRLPADAAHTPA